jgi:hypothetical protein
VILSSSSSRVFIHNIFCTRQEGCTFYQKEGLDGTCPNCGGMALLKKCIHVSDEYEFWRKEVSFQSFKYVTYDIDGGQERKIIQLVTYKYEYVTS